MYSIKKSIKKKDQKETIEERLVTAIASDNVTQVRKLLQDNNELLNKILPAKLPNPAKPSTPIQLSYTALGCAIYLGKEEIVILLLTFEKLSLNAGDIFTLLKDAEDFAKHLKKSNIANLIAQRKIQDKMKNLVLDKSNADAMLQDSATKTFDSPAAEQGDPVEKLYQYLSNNELDLAKQILANSVSTLLVSKKAEDAIVLKFIDLFILETKHTRWILRQNNKEETRAESRDDLLNENKQDVIARRNKRNQKLQLIREVIEKLCPKVK
jgi:hypothetical protein